MAMAASANAGEPLGRTSAVQAPAWILRDGARSAAAPDTVLQTGDRVFTGPGGRLHLDLADGGIVKLGASAEFALDLPARPREDAVFSAALRVLKGAFRYSTRALGALQRRDIEVYVGPTITAGIRGTDIWGKSDAGQALICLIEGRIDVRSTGAPTQTMQEPGSFYVVPTGQPPQPIAQAPAEKLASWVPQTELEDVPARYAVGRYALRLEVLPERGAATARQQAYDAQGYSVEVVAHGERFALRMNGFGSASEARRYGAIMTRQFELADVVVLPP